MKKEITTVFSQTKKDRIDHIIFICLTCALALVCLKGFEFDGERANAWFGIVYSFDRAMPLVVAIPVIILFLGLCVLFIIRRKVQFHRKELIITSIFIVIAVYRILTYLIFPTGEIVFQFLDPYTSSEITLTYSDYLTIDKVIECLSEVCFLFYFYVALAFFTDIKNDDGLITEIVYHLFALVAVVMTFYSLIFETDGLINNFYDLIGVPGYNFVDVTSFTSHRNVFGFFITLAVISEIVVFFRRANIVSLILMFYLTIFSIFIHSRTTICICLLLCFLTAVLFSIFNFQKHKVISGIFIGLFSCAVVFVIVFFAAFRDSEIVTILISQIESFFNFQTLFYRGSHIYTSFALLMSNPWFFWFGFGRVPYTSIYHQYLVTIDYEVEIVTSHCGFIEPFLYQGVIMGVLQLFGYIAILGYIIYMFTQKRTDRACGFIVAFFGLSLHSTFESRGLFIFDSTSVLYMLVLLLPVLEEYSYYSAHKTAIINDRRVELLTYKL